jgi:hypothetical protein
MTSGKPATPPADARPGDDLTTLLDGRRRWLKAGRAREQERSADLGGADQLSAAQRSLIRRLVNVELWIEATEARILGGSAADDDELVTLWLMAIKVHMQLSVRLGLKRRAKDVPTLQDYLRQKAAEKEQEPHA